MTTREDILSLAVPVTIWMKSRMADELNKLGIREGSYDLGHDILTRVLAPAPTPPAAEAPAQEYPANATQDDAIEAAEKAAGNTDDAPPMAVFAALRVCARAWVPDARIIGNIRAGDIASSIDWLFAPPTYADAEAKGFERGIETAAKWHDEQAQMRRSQAAEAQGRGDRSRPRHLISQAYSHDEDAAFIRSLASPAPKGEA